MIQVLDDKIALSTLKACIQYAESAQYIPLHGAGDSKNEFKFSHYDVGSVICFKQLYQELKNYIPDNYEVARSYINAMVYGQEDVIHQDDTDFKNGLTVIVYLTNKWFPEWFGQTVFFENTTTNRENNFVGADITQSILPRFNRALIFDKNIYHCVAPISKRFTGVRLTCMFKLKLIK